MSEEIVLCDNCYWVSCSQLRISLRKETGEGFMLCFRGGSVDLDEILCSDGM